VSVLDDGRPLVVSTEQERIGRGPWARLFASAIAGDESSSSAERGRALARSGAVHTVEVREGTLSARVEDGESESSHHLPAEPVPPRIWAAAARSARTTPQLVAAVEGKAQSVQLEHVMAVDWEEPLVPIPSAIRRTCTCDGQGRCAHVAALGYAVADRIDREPSLLLRWRGCTDDAPAPATEPEPEPIEASDEIWEAPPPPELGAARPLPPAAVLKRLGASGIQVGGRDLAEVLERAYATFASLGK
jgi:uncharacterized Zn finger protein